jgi:hypothetical protein
VNGYLKIFEYLWKLLLDDVDRVNSATSAYDIEDFPVLTQSLWEHSTIKCMHWIQNKLRKTIPIEPTHNPANDTALGSASIPGPTFPFITWIIVWSMLRVDGWNSHNRIHNFLSNGN